MACQKGHRAAFKANFLGKPILCKRQGAKRHAKMGQPLVGGRIFEGMSLNVSRNCRQKLVQFADSKLSV